MRDRFFSRSVAVIRSVAVMKHSNVRAIPTSLMIDHLLASGDDSECGVCRLLSAFDCECWLYDARQISIDACDCMCRCHVCESHLTQCECELESDCAAE